MYDDLIIQLPEEIVTKIWQLVWELMSPQCKMQLNRHFYLKYHPVFLRSLKWNTYTSLVRLAIRNRMGFVFENIYINSTKWDKPKHYVFKGSTYPNFFTYVNQQTIAFNFNQARELMSSVKDGNGKQYRNRKGMKNRHI